MGKPCQICGKSGYMYYPLCKEHLEMKANGKVVKCPDCGQWHLSDTACKCQAEIEYTELPTEGFDSCVVCGVETNGYAFCRKCWKKYTTEEMLDILNGTESTNTQRLEDKEMPIKNDDVSVTSENEQQELKIGKCLTCSNSTSDGFLFCPECYHKYKNKTLLLKVEKCLSVTIQDESYEGVYVCDDGHIVKSMAEREIDDYLYAKGIKHSYEPPYDPGNGRKPIKPDFLLEDYLGEDESVYIEYWGFDESFKEYTERKKYKLNIYRENKDTIVCLSAKHDIKNIKFALKTKLKKDNIKIHEINGED
ncbi:MAG: hypothetical protein NC548_48510 [Lachnospiraceae bacterium]|nr:hypothetical protein [Lachnospiraceae bacterium]